jgi:hypothetical protein
MKIEVSNGEILDKYSILSIKTERIKDSEKLKNIKQELLELDEISKSILEDARVLLLYNELKKVNSSLWDIEDLIRDCERRSDFAAGFVELARSVYRTNDLRSDIKRKINVLTGSTITEEKSYQKY